MLFIQNMQRFELIKKIGSGAYSEVFKAWDYVTNSYVAIKQTNHSNPDVRIVLNRELRILKKFNHPNIVKLLGCYSDTHYTYLILEYLPYDLITYYKQLWKQKRIKFSDREITRIIYQVCKAIAYMHTLNIMHRDIKPQNILFDPQTFMVKIIDFGFATEINFYGRNTDYMVTRWYRPLQIVLGLPYDLKIDIFSLGAVLLELYMGQQVFKSASNIDQLYWIYQICGFPNWEGAIQKLRELGISLNPSKQPYIFQLTKSLRYQATNLILGMLQTIPYLRLNIQQIINHSYFSEFHQTKKRITSQQTQNIPSSLIPTSLNLNLQRITQNSRKYHGLLSDRTQKNRNLEDTKVSLPGRRKSQANQQSYSKGKHAETTRHQHQNYYIPHQRQYQQRLQTDSNLHTSRKFNNYSHNNYPNYQTSTSLKSVPQEEPRDGRTKSLRLQITSDRKFSLSTNNQQYFTPKNQIKRQTIKNVESERKFVPLKLKPDLSKKNPTFSKIRSKILENNVKTVRKNKISLSQRFNMVGSYDSKRKDHIGIQLITK